MTAEAARTAGGPAFDWAPVEDEALALFRALLRIDTSNPPGNEKPAAELLADALRKDGLEPVLLESAPGRANVVARIKGTGAAPPLLLNAHLDVVTAEGQAWTRPPYGAEIHDGWLYGRGAVDMKNMAAMSVMVLRLLARSGIRLERDVIFAGVADEENGCRLGSEYLVAEHPDLVRAEYALGELGGFTLHLGKVAYYPIQVAHKGSVWGRLRARGPAGHGSMPREDSAVVRLAQAVAALGAQRLPQHVSEPVRLMIEGLAKAQGAGLALVLRGLLNPVLAPRLLKLFPNPSVARVFAALLANTVSPTVLRAGDKTNVIPAEAVCEFDGRTVPGQTADDLVREIRAIVGEDLEVELFDTSPPITSPADSPLFRALGDAVRRAEPDAQPIPYVMPGYTDARAYAKLGIKHYGFAPVKLPPGIAYADLYHGVDERIPVDGFKWGVRMLWDAVSTFCAEKR